MLSFSMYIYIGNNISRLTVCTHKFRKRFLRCSRRLSFGERPGDRIAEPPNKSFLRVPRSSSRCSASCARKRLKASPDCAPTQGEDNPVASAASCGSSYGAPTHECTPIAMSVVTSVSGMKTDIRRLSDAVSRHAAVVSEIRDAIKLLTGQRAHVLAGEPTKGRCGECECCRRTPAIKVPKRNHAPKKTSKTCRQGNIITGPEPKKGPVIDTNFTVDHIPFTTKRSKKQMRKPCKGRKEPRFGCTLTVVSFQYIFIELFSSAGYLQTHSMNVFQVDLTSDDGVGKSRGRTTPKPAVEATSPPGRQKRDVHPLDSTGVVNLSGQHSIHVEAIPKSMNLVFRPTEEMNLSLVDLAVAAYIFNQDLSESEVLVDVGDCFASRGALMTLAPKREVVDDVLNAVVRMLTNGSKRSCWFLPTIIMQAALCGRSLTSANMTSIRNNYMRSKVDQTTRIYQPMWSDQHWYLMIVDIPRMKLVYLDSLRDPREADARKTAIIRVALYLEGVTLGKSWLSGPEAMRPRFSTFEFEEPEVPQQQGDSMDCGVWVAQWMIREHLWQDYGVQHVYNATRMRLAVDLVMKSHNKLAEDAVSKAFRHWKQKLV